MTCVKLVASCFLVMKLVWFTVLSLHSGFPCEQMVESLEQVDGDNTYKCEIRKVFFFKKI